MSIENRMFRQQQRDAGNPYKEESRSWIAWSRGYVAGQLAMAGRQWEAATGQKVKMPKTTFADLRRPENRSDQK